MSRLIEVYCDWETLGAPQRMGSLRSESIQRDEVFSFAYEPQWLATSNATVLDPDLQLYEGPQYPAEKSRMNFGMFLDSSPDRWGHLLMQRREAVEARLQNRNENRLLESDYLIGVHDEQRMGALRFKLGCEGPFLSSEEGMSVPPWTRLRELEEAAWQVQTSSSDGRQMREWLSLLMAPGSSIGGARPKAGVCDEQGELWIAKFPARSDEVDIAAWEMVANELANKAGLSFAEARLEQFGHEHHIYMAKRFDRRVVDGNRKRVHFASAMTMLGYNDGTDASMGASYLEIVEFLSAYGADVTADLQELWKRIVFFVCISNTDDHLRNHGFLLTANGWKLSPAYDVNPVPHGHGLSLNISENDNSLDLGLVHSVCEYFRIKSGDANKLIEHIQAVVRDWPKTAKKFGLTRDQQQLMAAAFQCARK